MNSLIPENPRKAAQVVSTVTAFLVPLLVGAIVFLVLHSFSQDNRISRNATQATQALCALRADLQLRVDESVGFLKTHPTGILGVSAASINNTIDSQRRTIMALSVLAC